MNEQQELHSEDMDRYDYYRELAAEGDDTEPMPGDGGEFFDPAYPAVFDDIPF